MKIHPNDTLLEEFLLSLSAERRKLFDHLIRCSVCRARVRYLPRSLEPQAQAEPGSSSDYGAAMDRIAARLTTIGRDLAMERDSAPSLYVELTEVPPERRELLLRNSSRFHTLGLFELLIERSLEVTVRDPLQAESLARLALTLSGHLDAMHYGNSLIQDLRARTWAYIANARRVRSDLQGAADAFGMAWTYLSQGSEDALEKAILLDLEASLLRAQRKFDRALKLLRRALALFLKNGEAHRAGRTLVNMSIVHNHAGQPELGIPLLFRALELIDPEQEPRLLLCTRHNLAVTLAELGRFQEAWSLYQETRGLYRDFTDAWTQNRRRWVKGKMARGLGQLAQAESLFLAARDGFVAEGIPYDTALVSLELATLYAEQGRTADLKRLAEEMVLIFASRQIHREALAALAFLKQAVEAERASVGIVSEVASYLRRAQHDPDLRFEAPN